MAPRVPARRRKLLMAAITPGAAVMARVRLAVTALRASE
jgi:hypothetical protein